MDAVSEIKARLSIDQLVSQYVQLTKKGRNFVGLCPFHQDSHPSFLVSPDKGICYCFPCQKGGDIFSFYQQIEGVDFRQALKDLAEKAGVTLPDVPVDHVKKDEKDRARECLMAAQVFYAQKLQESQSAQQYLQSRGLLTDEIRTFGLGVAPDSFSATYDHLLKAGFSRKDILAAGLGVQKDLREERIYDRFRHRLMFPIHDHQGRIIGFGGRALEGGSSANAEQEPAKYLNVSDTALYRKSSVLYGLHHALKAMREANRIVLVEGYFDVLACHRVGVHEVAATCGTALTEEHVKLLKRSVERVVLCLDQDRAGRDAAERAFILCAKEGLQVEGIVLGQKDPADAAVQSPESLRSVLTQTARPFIELICADIRSSDIRKPEIMRAALQRLLPLLRSITSSTERDQAVKLAASTLGTTETALLDDLQSLEREAPRAQKSAAVVNTVTMFTTAEVSLGLILLYPRTIDLLKELIRPEEEFAARLFDALASIGNRTDVDINTLPLSDEDRKAAGILHLYCEENGFGNWSDSIATREIRQNVRMANREMLLRKQKDITTKLLDAQKEGKADESLLLVEQYRGLLELSRKAQ